MYYLPECGFERRKKPFFVSKGLKEGGMSLGKTKLTLNLPNLTYVELSTFLEKVRPFNKTKMKRALFPLVKMRHFPNIALTSLLGQSYQKYTHQNLACFRTVEIF